MLKRGQNMVETWSKHGGNTLETCLKESQTRSNPLIFSLISLGTNTNNKKDAPLNEMQFIGLKCMGNVY